MLLITSASMILRICQISIEMVNVFFSIRFIYSIHCVCHKCML